MAGETQVQPIQRGGEIAGTFLRGELRGKEKPVTNFGFARRKEVDSGIVLGQQIRAERPQKTFMEVLRETARGPETPAQTAERNITGLNDKIEAFKGLSVTDTDVVSRRDSLTTELQDLQTTLRGAEIARMQQDENLDRASLDDAATKERVAKLLGVDPATISEDDLWSKALETQVGAEQQIENMGFVKAMLGDIDLTKPENRNAVNAIKSAMLADPDVQAKLHQRAKNLIARTEVPTDPTKLDDVKEKLSKALATNPSAQLRDALFDVIEDRNNQIEIYNAAEKERISKATEGKYGSVIKDITDKWMEINRDQGERIVGAIYHPDQIKEDMLTIMYKGKDENGRLEGLRTIIARQVRASGAEGIYQRDASGKIVMHGGERVVDNAKLDAVVDSLYDTQGTQLRKVLAKAYARSGMQRGKWANHFFGDKEDTLTMNSPEEAVLFTEAFGDEALIDALRDDMSGDKQALKLLNEISAKRNEIPKSNWAIILKFLLYMGAGGITVGLLTGGIPLGPILDILVKAGVFVGSHPITSATVAAGAAAGYRVNAEQPARGYTPIVSK